MALIHRDRSDGITSAHRPDLIGPLYDRLAEHGGGTGIFMNSAQGGMVTADNRSEGGDSRTWAECQRIGLRHHTYGEHAAVTPELVDLRLSKDLGHLQISLR